VFAQRGISDREVRRRANVSNNTATAVSGPHRPDTFEAPKGLNRHSPDSESVGPDPSSLEASRQQKFQNSLAADRVTAPKGGLVDLAAPKLAALP